MSLQVWLPLTKDLRQQGISNVTPSLLGNPTYTNGKLGQALNITTDGQGINLKEYMTELKTYTTYSMAAWVYLDSTATNHSSTIISSGNWNDAAGQCCFGFYSYSSGYGVILCPNTSNWSGGVSLSSKIQLNNWYHIAIAYNGSKTVAYVNGEKVGEYNGGGICQSSETNNVYIGSATYYSGFTLKGKINDVRVYDHCLSLMEVKELSKGLVLHYPLNRGGFGQENLATITSTNQYQWTAGSNYHYIWLNGGTLEPNTIYTFSAEVTIDNNVDRCTIFNYTAGDYTGSQTNYFPADGKRHSWTFTTSATAVGLIAYAGPAGQDANNTAVYKNIKIEKGDKATPYIPRSNETLYTTMGLNGTTEYDCSGLCNNGTRTGTLAWTSDTPKYDVSTYFDGSSYIVSPSGSFTWFDFNKCTIAAWIKPTTTPSAYSGSIGITHDQDAGHKCLAISNYAGKFTVNSTNGSNYVNYGSGYTMPLNEWHHYVATLDGTALKMYVDGELKASTTLDFGTGGISSSTRVNIAVDLPGTDEKYTGYYSDARIYTTALSADDVLSLYKNSHLS